MNRIYRLLWSAALGQWVPVSELGSRSRPGSSAARRLRRALAAGATTGLVAGMVGLGGVGGVQAAPAGGQVTHGTGSISQQGNTTTIHQGNQNLSLSWQSFNVAPTETVNFQQPNATAIAVNRINSSTGSEILGHLNANGQVYLINPHGVLFGQNAQINVSGLVASTLDIADSDLNQNSKHFQGDGTGAVINKGHITIADGGTVALLGNTVSNQGVITAHLGSVALGAGKAMTLTFDGNKLLTLHVDKSTLNNLAENKQLIVADGGQVLMTAGARDSLLASVVNNTGVIQAQTVENHNGVITLMGGMQAGITNVAGTLDASAPTGGDGGFIETSAAHVHVADSATITAKATNGKTGTWLIDPTDFTIAASGGDITGTLLSTQLGSANVTIQSSSGASGTAGDVNVNDSVSWGTNILTLNAQNNININAAMNATGTADLALEYGQGAVAAGNTSAVQVNAPVNLASTGSFSTKLGSDGTTTSYTIIDSLGSAGSTTGTDLQGMSGNLAGKYVLGANIDATATSGWNAGAGFAPVGDNTNNFTGIFDGLGHTISGLTINRPSTSYVGLFGRTATGTAIRNVGLIGESVNGGTVVGGLVARNSSTISNSYAVGSVSGDSNVGGLVGYNGSTISDSYASGSVTGSVSGAYVGGLVGSNYSAINKSYATSSVSGGSSGIGGLVGASTGTISNSYATGSVTGSGDNVGGLVGSNTSTVSNSYATGAVSGSSYVGGLVGRSYGSAVTNSYWSTDTSGTTTGVGGGTATGVTGLTTAALIAALPGGFSTSVWGNGDNQTTPYLLGMAGNKVFNVNDLPSGAISSTNRPNLYTVIQNVDQLQAMSGSLAGRYVLGANIDASTTSGWNAGTGFIPIGNGSASSYGTGFTGVFDGLGHHIDNLVINSGLRAAGLFQSLDGGTLRNVGLVGGSVTDTHYDGNVTHAVMAGALVGYSYAGSVITNAFATGAVTGGMAANVGGLVGVNTGSVTNVYASGAVTGGSVTDVGGLVGVNSGSVSNAYATGIVTGGNGGSKVGGLVGASSGSLTNVYATGAATGGTDAFVGGLTGSSNSSGSVTNAYATGVVTGDTGAYVGGLLGYNNGTITASYWDTETTGVVAGVGYGGGTGATGMTTAQMQTQANFTSATSANGNVNPNWDFTNTWGMYDGHTDPLLRTFMTSLTVTANAVSTTYNGLAYSGGNGVTYSAVPNGNLLGTLSYGGSSQGAVNAGSYAITPGGFYSNQQGYLISYTAGALTINKANLTLGGTLTYDGTTAVAGSALTATGINGQTFSVTGTGDTSNLASKNVQTGSNLASVTGLGIGTSVNGGLASNYNALGTVGSSVSITPAALSVTGTTAANKVYDGTTAATVNTTGVVYAGLISGDAVTVHATGSFADKNVGKGKTVTLVSSYSGADVGNYQITNQATTTAGITAKAITMAATGTNKVYDGTTTDAVTLGSSGVISGDAVNFSNTAANFADKDVGTNKAVTVVGIAASGADAGNYSFNNTSATTAANITPAALSISGITAANKVYDGTTAATVNTTGVVYTGLIAGDAVTVSTTGRFGDKNVGTGKTVTLASSYSGADVGNYSISNQASATANITPATLTATATPTTIPVGPIPVLSGMVSGFMPEDTLANSSTGNLRWVTTATDYSMPGQYAINGVGLSAQNYVIDQAAGNATALNIMSIQQGEAFVNDLMNTGVPIATPDGLGSDSATGIGTGNPRRTSVPAAPTHHLRDYNIQLALRVIDGGVRLPEEANP